MSGIHLTGVLTVADSINTNGRCYPKVTLVTSHKATERLIVILCSPDNVQELQSILTSEAQRFHREEILKGKGFGDLDHPQYFSSSYSIVDPTTASHQVNSASNCWSAASQGPLADVSLGPCVNILYR